MPDIYCRNQDGTYDVAFEVKRSSRDHIYVDRDDFANLYKLESRTPWLLDCVFAYKFSNREMFTHSLPIKSKDTVSDVMDRYVSEYGVETSVSDVRRSSEERIRVDKPNLENGVSATKGRPDAEVLASCLPE
jgi:Holliday junction resolvase